MPQYRRAWIPGGTFFFTLVTQHRKPWLIEEPARNALRKAIEHVRCRRPFEIDAWVLLPEHLHCIWTLPEGDADFATRWRLIKHYVSRQLSKQDFAAQNDLSRLKRGEASLWQRRFWEHLIKDEADYHLHCDYIHYNPVKHGLCQAPVNWPYSSLRRLIAQGLYPSDWAVAETRRFAGLDGAE